MGKKLLIPDNQLPCSIGNEIELQIVNDRGEILRGEELIKIWDAIFVNIKNVFYPSLKMLPEEIRNRVTGAHKVRKEKQGRKLPYVEVKYQALGREFHINVIGPDPNISQVTWLMELVTPPAISMQEYAWWNLFLNSVLVKALPDGYWVLPLGLNPVEKEYMSGVTFGEHYHIGVDDPALKLAIYTLIRNFVPQLIALSVNSPFLNKKPTGTVKIANDEGIQILAKDCTRSLRLFNNKGQMGPVDKETYIPCMETLDHDAFCDVIRRKPPDDRFVDVYPFTNYGTIELRVFDTQLSLSRRLAIVAIIEAICLKAKRLIEKGETIPCVLSSVLIANREKAVLFGLQGKFTPDTMLPHSFGMTYNEDPQTGKQNGKLFQAVSSMLFFLKKEIVDLGLKDVILPVILSISGNKKVKAPIAPADYLLYIYEKNSGDMARALDEFKRFQQEYCTGSNIELGDPIVDEWGSLDQKAMPVISPVMQDASQSQIQAQAEVEDIDFSNIDVEVTEPQINTVGPIPYRLSFMVSSNGPLEMLEIMIIQQLIETQKKSEIVLATSFTKLRFMANNQVTITSELFPLVPRQDLFVGNKQCRLKFVIKAHKEATAYSNSFRIELLPRYGITSEFKKKKLVASEKYDIKYKIGTTGSITPGAHVGLTFKFQVLSGDLKTVLHQEEKKLDVREQETLVFKLVPQAAWKERAIVLRLVAMLNEKVIARHEITDLSLEIPEDEQLASMPRQAQKKGDFWPAKKPVFSPPEPSISENKYKLVKSLAFSKTGSTDVKREPVSSRTSSSQKKVVKIENKPVPARRQKSTPAKAKPVARSKPGKNVATSKVASSPPVASLGKKVKKGIQEKEKKPVASHGSINLPFLEPLDPTIAKLDITPKLQSSRLVAPGERISIVYTARKSGIIGENEPLKILSFLINSRNEFIVVTNDRYKFTGETSIYTLNIDPGKQFKNWKPTSPFHVVFQVYKDNTLVGQSTYSDFELARFTTSSQVNWKKIDLLSNTIYPGMDAGFDLEVELKTMVNPVAFSIEASCQGASVSTDFLVATEGANCAMAPFRVPYQGLTTVPNATMIVKIKDTSGMIINEQKKIVAIIAKGPTFVIPNASLDSFEGLDRTRLAFDIMNDSSIAVSCHVTIIAIDLACTSKILASKKIKLRGSETQTVEIERIDIPLNAIRADTVMIDFLVEIDDFNKIKNLLRKIISIDPSPGEAIDVYFHGKLSNPDNIHDITRYIDNVNITLDFRKDITLDGCKAKVMEIVDGVEERVIKIIKLPRGKERVHDTLVWNPPRAKNFPRLCKLEIQFYQDKDIITSDRIVSDPLFFTILPD